MPLACVSVPRFALAIELRSLIPARAAAAYPQIIVHAYNRVLEASPQLTDAWPGRPLRQARALYPQAVCIGADHTRYREANAAFLRALQGISPEVEPASDALGRAYVGVRGLERMYGKTAGQPPPTAYGAIAQAIVEGVRDTTGLLPAVAVAANKFTARVAAALCGPGETAVIEAGSERAFLREKPVSMLPFEPEITERLRALALFTLGDVAGLPRPAVEAQFGGPGGRMWDLANGIDGEPLVPQQVPEAITERLAFEAPVATSEALIMAARQVVRRLSARLGHRAARKMHAQVLSEGRITWERVETFRSATADETRMMTLLKTRLGMLQLGETVDTVEVTLSDLTREPGRQAKLITETNPQIERLLEAVQEIRVRFGSPMVWRAVEVDPCSRHPEDRTILIPYDA